MMLYEQVKEMEKKNCGKGLTTATGCCRFCGQSSVRQALQEWGDEEFDELATETCQCGEARFYAHKKEQKAKANARIAMLFGKEKEGIAVPEAAVDLMHEAVSAVCEGFVQSVNIDIGDGIKCKINITSKDNVKVSRTKTDISTYEA